MIIIIIFFQIRLKMSKQDKIVLSYHDSLLRNSDVFLLKNSHWLNDAIIGFYFEYLEQTLESNDNSKNIKLFSPEVTQLLKMTDQEFPFISTDMDYIFFPLNNCKNSDAAGGSHWSLLVYSKAEKTCFHFDSAHGNNNSEARSFGLKISKQLHGDEAARFKNVQCPQQDNGYDCGIFVLCFTDAILEHLKSSPSVETCNFSKVKSLGIDKRRKLLDLIKILSQESNQ
ncbi:GSCOCG00000745001-RA-CDS [Cotesia congregata]|nr:GSCOCG00000745001-RA-CDS [Cotesia congregata]